MGVEEVAGSGTGDFAAGSGLLLEKISSPYLAISSAWLKTELLLGCCDLLKKLDFVR